MAKYEDFLPEHIRNDINNVAHRTDTRDWNADQRELIELLFKAVEFLDKSNGIPKYVKLAIVIAIVAITVITVAAYASVCCPPSPKESLIEDIPFQPEEEKVVPPEEEEVVPPEEEEVVPPEEEEPPTPGPRLPADDEGIFDDPFTCEEGRIYVPEEGRCMIPGPG